MRRRAVSHRPKTISPLLGLAPGGGYLAICITANAGGLLHHLFIITRHFALRQSGGLFVSVALIRQVSPPRMLSDAVLYGVRTFLDPDMQSRNCPTNLRWLHDTRCKDESQPWTIFLKGGHFKKSH